MKSIAIYAGKGASATGVNQLVSVLEHDFLIQLVDASFFLNSKWKQKTSLLLFPGGRDLYYHEALKGKPNQIIREFVEEGGSYFGICAGAYYGAQEIEFEKGHPLQIISKRELAFYPGKAIGPAYGPGLFQYNSETGARSALISSQIGEIPIYFNGGCFFDNPKVFLNTQIIASYKDLSGLPAAIISCSIGQGTALLSGVHPEYHRPLLTHLLSLIIS